MTELNEKITSDTVTEIFGNVDLKKAINRHYSASGLVPMHQRGSHPIYGIYTLSTIQVSAGPYLPFVIIPSDNHLIWFKIKFDSAFGATLDTLVPNTALRINFQNPTPQNYS